MSFGNESDTLVDFNLDYSPSLQTLSKPFDMSRKTSRVLREGHTSRVTCKVRAIDTIWLTLSLLKRKQDRLTESS